MKRISCSLTKRVLIVLLAVLCMASFYACKNNSADDSGSAGGKGAAGEETSKDANGGDAAGSEDGDGAGERDHYGTAEIKDLVIGESGKARIYLKSASNRLKASFTLSCYAGQRVAFVDKNGREVAEIKVNAEEGDRDVNVTCEVPDRKWMDRKTSYYRVRSFGNALIDESGTSKAAVHLENQYEYYDKPVEGSMVWYGGAGRCPASRSGVILAVKGEIAFVRGSDGRTYKWNVHDMMINMADVRTDIVYDIYNAYSSRFYPISGRAMYMDNGGAGLARYAPVAKEDAMHRNKKTGKTTFMVPVQWDFAKTVALAQHRARKSGCTLYIVDSFRPMYSVNPVAKAVGDAGMLAYGGTSAHNFGFAVDTGWQEVDKSGNPVGQPYTLNLQALDRKLAVRGPHGNQREPWWDGVNKLVQEWWHYGDTNLRPAYRAHAERVGSLYVNLGEPISRKRSRL